MSEAEAQALAIFGIIVFTLCVIGCLALALGRPK
jgi:cbb3-type cytochrome oxidase subunit 3